MQDLVGIIRIETELKEALEKIAALRAEAAAVSVEGNRQYNPGWHLALDLRNMLLVSEAVAMAALERQESRGGHTRDDFPMTDPYWGGHNVVVEVRPPPAGPDGSVLSRAAPAAAQTARPSWPNSWRTSIELRPEAAHLARRRERRRAEGLRCPGRRGPGRPRRRPPRPGHPCQRPGREMELQGRQVRVVLRRSQRPAPAHVHDPAVHLPEGEPVTITPLRTFPVIKDLVTDVSFNYQKARQVPAFTPSADQPVAPFTMYQADVERSQEFRKCIECWLCQNTCHVVRDHEENKPHFAGPRFFIRYAELDMHPNDGLDREELRPGLGGPRLLQHHQVLHRGVPRAHQDHRQRDHPDEGASRRRQVRPRRPFPRATAFRDPGGQCVPPRFAAVASPLAAAVLRAPRSALAGGVVAPFAPVASARPRPPSAAAGALRG